MGNRTTLRSALLTIMSRSYPAGTFVEAGIVIKDKVAGPDGLVTVKVEGSNAYPNYGKIDLTYHKRDIASFFKYTGTSLTIVPGVSFTDILTGIERATGFQFTDDDFITQPVVWSDGVCVIQLISKDTSDYWYGSVTLNLTPKLKDLSLLITRPNIVRSVIDYTQAMFVSALSTQNKCFLELNRVSFGDVVATADAGLPTTYNSAVKLTGIPAMGFTGEVWAYFNRVNLASSFSGQYYNVPDNYRGGLIDSLVYENIGLRALLTVDHLQDIPINYDVYPYTVSLTAKSNDYTCYGTAPITIRRQADDTQSATLTFSANDTVMTDLRLEQLVGKLVARAGVLNLTIVVNAGVWVVGATSAAPALNFRNMSKYGVINYNVINNGFISGRGGTGLGNSQFSPVTNKINVIQNGGDGVSIEDDLRGTVTIDNTNGTIAGGGGGGANWRGGFNVSGGGGQPLGAVGSESSNASNITGSPGSLTAPGGGSVGNSTVYYYSGGGGALGRAGKCGYQIQKTAPLYGWTQSSSTVGDPGKAILKNADKITWVSPGIQLPAKNDYQEFVDWIQAQGIMTVPSNRSTGDLPLPAAGKMWALLPENYLMNSTNMYGGVYGAYLPWMAGNGIPSVLCHLYPTVEDYFDSYVHDRLSVIVLGGGAGGNFSAVVRNLKSSNATSGVLGYRIERFIYFDRTQDRMMEYNPYARSTPIPWVKPKISLALTDGELRKFS